jgi:hypothetical protein
MSRLKNVRRRQRRRYIHYLLALSKLGNENVMAPWSISNRNGEWV